jgi:limonene-1,2-epoxide hydrolase
MPGVRRKSRAQAFSGAAACAILRPSIDCERTRGMTNTKIVEAFIRAWEEKSIEDILGLMTPDARYLNVGLSEAVGHEQIRAGVAPFLAAASRIEWIVHHIGENAQGVVFTERTDVFEMPGRTISVPVMGIFELTDGLISGWRDYFDLPGFQKQMT